jgi:hypothetical protein
MNDVRKLGLTGSVSVRFSMTSLILHQQLHSVIHIQPLQQLATVRCCAAKLGVVSSYTVI